MATAVTGNGHGRSSGLSGGRGGCGSPIPVPPATQVCDCRVAARTAHFSLFLGGRAELELQQSRCYKLVCVPSLCCHCAAVVGEAEVG